MMTDFSESIMPLAGCDELFRDLLTKDVEIPYGRFNYPCRLKLTLDARYLSVQLHGNIPIRSEAVLPVFGRWNYGKVLGAHVLSICDPTLYLNDNLSVGWYMGSKEENAVRGVVAIAYRCAEVLGIAPERIVFSGSSGGGFAALQAAALVKNGKAIAINAQTDLMKFTQTLVQPYVDLVAGYLSIEEARNAFGNRWNAIEALQAARNSGSTPRIIIVQNKNDWHYQEHFIPFAETFGLNFHKEQSVNGYFMSILYEGPHGHCSETPEVVKRINNEGVPFLLGNSTDTFMPDFSTQITLASGKIQAVIQPGDGDYQFACYLCKDGIAIEKRFYSSNNNFSYNLSEPGEYSCLGFVRDKSGQSFSKFSAIIQVGERVINK